MEHIATVLERSIKTIPTYYAGVRFRSRLEASYAMALDGLGVRWSYETEGYEIEGTFYLPDIYLPKIKTFLEIKGPLVPGLEKAHKLYTHLNRDQPEGLWHSPCFMVVWGDECGEIRNIVDNDSVVLATCGKCGGKWFLPEGGSFVCRACGFYDGPHHILETVDRLTLGQITLRRE